MKKLCFLMASIFCGYFQVNSQDLWNVVSSPIDENLVSLCFIDDDTGWIASAEGSILYTDNGGQSWMHREFPQYHFESIHFTDENFGCVVGWHENIIDSSLILITTDGGGNWNEAEHPKVSRLNDVFFINENRGWAVGARGENNLNCCLFTDDAGATWTIQTGILVSQAELFAVHFRDENNGNICGNDGAFFLTNNAGNTGWALGISMPLLDLNGIFNFGSQNGCMVGEAGIAFYTLNRWTQYIETNTQVDVTLHAVSGYPPVSLWAAGDGGTIIFTSNYLFGWITQETGVDENIRDIHITGQLSGWAVGDNGTILHMNPFSSVSEIPSGELIVFPNPADVNIILKINKPDDYRAIEIFNSAGKQMLYMDQIDDGNLVVNSSTFPAGIYILKLYGKTNVICKKISIY